jgi:hypothetical protein
MDSGSMHNDSSKFTLKTIDIYYHMKMLMGHALVERHEGYQEILLKIDDVQKQIKLVDYKLNLIVSKLVGLDLPQPRVTIDENCFVV